MRREGRAEWVGRTGGGGLEEGRSTAWIWWRRPEEWARVIAEWVEETGQKNTVLTLYELTKSEATLSQGTFVRCDALRLVGGEMGLRKRDGDK